MSQYRDDRDAARHRIEALEAKLAEREAELASKGAVLAERTGEIARLRRELEVTGNPVRRGPRHAAWAMRMVGLSVGVAAIAMALGVWAIRAPRTVADTTPKDVAPRDEPIFADPAPFTMGGDPPNPPAQPVAVRHDPTEAEPSSRLAPIDEDAVRRQLEAKVWAGRGSLDDIRMLKAICSHQGDRTCRDRAAALYEGSKPKVF